MSISRSLWVILVTYDLEGLGPGLPTHGGLKEKRDSLGQIPRATLLFETDPLEGIAGKISANSRSDYHSSEISTSLSTHLFKIAR